MGKGTRVPFPMCVGQQTLPQRNGMPREACPLHPMMGMCEPMWSGRDMGRSGFATNQPSAPNQPTPEMSAHPSKRQCLPLAPPHPKGAARQATHACGRPTHASTKESSEAHICAPRGKGAANGRRAQCLGGVGGQWEWSPKKTLTPGTNPHHPPHPHTPRQTLRPTTCSPARPAVANFVHHSVRANSRPGLW